eukprot:gnl/Dysnectes_brevis/627_a694_4886.p1 GENE.gnl/Dysnectes_brevis/627_a694_4886~~gnl/Dysnectes_brevis/627_a694_4886.p1  ORF type:complete len:166 (-),score=60.20 gnl/Dysnectes_brevis/627_a694_4886:59-556(-)
MKLTCHLLLTTVLLAALVAMGVHLYSLQPALTSLDVAARNKQSTKEFFQYLMGDSNYEEARKYVGAYIQHDPRVADGFDALVEFLSTSPKFKDRPQTTIQYNYISAEGDMVYMQNHKEFEMDGEPARRNVVHVFRFGDTGKIEEHWTIAMAVKLDDCLYKDHPLY